MKKIIIIISFVMSLFLFTNVSALTHDSSDLTGRKVCSKYELAIAKSDGSIEKVTCHEDYLSAKASMATNSEKNLIIINESITNSKIVDAKYALLYLDRGSSVTTNIYPYSTHKSGTEDNYMNNSSNYGGTDAALIEYDNENSSYKIKISGDRGWIKASDVIAVVPVSWVKTTSYYKITSSDVYHYFASNIQKSGYSQMSLRLGPKPSNINAGSYYSYDGNYFYNDLYNLIDDYKDNKFNRSLNKSNPYYNYYQFLPHRTRSNYTIDDVDAYFRNQLKFVGSIYGKQKVTNYSVLYGEADSFMDSERKYGANAISMLSLSLNESAKGTSQIARYKNNVFGHSAYDSTPFSSASVYLSVSHNIDYHAYSYINYGYAEPTDWRYNGSHFGNKETGMNRAYASDVYWGEKAASYYYSFDRDNGMKDYNYYQLIVSNGTNIKARTGANTTSTVIQTIKAAGTPFVLLEEVKGEKVNNSDVWYKVQSDLNIDKDGKTIASSSSYPHYNWNGVMYVHSSYFIKINESTKTNNKYHSPVTLKKDVDDYTYTFMGTSKETNYKVGYLLSDTDFYTSSTLLTKKGTLVKNSFVTIIKEAKEKDGVNYLVVTNYGTFQKHWISGQNVEIVNRDLLKVSIENEGSYISSLDSIGGSENLKIYTNNQIPIVSYETRDNKIYLKLQIQNNGSIKYGYIDSTIGNITFTKDRTNLNDKAPVINASNKQIYMFDEYNILEGVTGIDPEDGDITSKIRVIGNNINIQKQGIYDVTYSLTDSYSNTVTKAIKVEVLYRDNPPVINASDKSILINTNFDPMIGVTGTDLEDGNITSSIIVTSNNVNTKVKGNYSVTYSLTDSYKNTVTKTIKVNVYTYTEANSLFMFDSFSHKKDNTFVVSGFMGVKGMDNTNVTHELIFVNENDKKEYNFKLNNWKDYPYEMSSLDDDKAYNYSGGWFKSELDLSKDKLPNGDYRLYIKVVNGKYTSKTYFTNIAYVDMTRRAKGLEREFLVDVDYGTLDSPILFSVRDTLISMTVPKNLDPMYNYISEVKNSNGLYLKGTSNNIGLSYKNANDIKRSIVLENKETFKRYTFDTKVTSGDYLISPAVIDNCDKKYAWFEITIPKSELEKLDKGTYIIYVMEIVSNETYYGEIKDVSYLDYTNLNKELNIELKMNEERRMRLELTVK